MRYHLDTNVIIDMERGRDQRLERVTALSGAGHVVEISVLVVAEYYSGTRRGVRPLIDAFLASLTRHAVFDEIAEGGAAYRRACARRGSPVSMVDALLAATALHYDAALVTSDTRLVAIDGLRVVSVDQL